MRDAGVRSGGEPAVQRFHLAALPAMRWKNGGGVTREIASVPMSAEPAEFAWRVSVAEIASDGPFSSFPGVDRVITLLAGRGAHLRSRDARVDHRLDAALVPFPFSGDDDIDATLLGGVCSDFNVMTRRSVCRAVVGVQRASAHLSAFADGVIYCVHGRWRVTGASPDGGEHSLEPGMGIWWCGLAAEWRLESSDAPAALLSVGIVRDAVLAESNGGER